MQTYTYSYSPADPTEAERRLDACAAAAQAFRAGTTRPTRWVRTGRFVRAIEEVGTGRLIFRSDGMEGRWYLLGSDEHGGGGERVPDEVLAAAGIDPRTGMLAPESAHA